MVITVDVDADVAVLVLDALGFVDGVLLLVAVHADVVLGVGVDNAKLALEKELVVAVDVDVVVLALEEELVDVLSDTDVLLAVDVQV